MTVVALSPFKCACISRDLYQSVSSNLAKDRQERYANILSASSVFAQASEEERARIATVMCEVVYKAGDRLIQLGTPVDCVYVVLHGNLSVYGKNIYLNEYDEEDGEEVHANITEGKLAGHLEMLFQHVASASVVVESPTAHVARISRYNFEKLVNE
uniref:cGMP-dependent protein kinase egl-4 n=1 Tax=Lygus hesperus TaxID=30085 RepID=A0A0A9Z197_LYGHE